MEGKSNPLVSCICITHNNIEILKKSIQCFQDQTYSNKELIVAFTSDNKSTANFLAQLKDPSIKHLIFQMTTPLTLGEKRNLAIASSKGSYFCIWDDDDWYSINRIEFHVNSVMGTAYKSSALSKVILYDITTHSAYLSATRWAWEQTLFCQNSVFDNSEFRYLNLDRGEDSVLVYNLKKNNWLLTIDQPDLYIYVYHGKNTFHRGHWEVNLLPWAKKLSRDQSSTVQKILEGEISNPDASITLKKFFP